MAPISLGPGPPTLSGAAEYSSALGWCCAPPAAAGPAPPRRAPSRAVPPPPESPAARAAGRSSGKLGAGELAQRSHALRDALRLLFAIFGGPQRLVGPGRDAALLRHRHAKLCRSRPAIRAYVGRWRHFGTSLSWCDQHPGGSGPRPYEMLADEGRRRGARCPSSSGEHGWATRGAARLLPQAVLFLSPAERQAFEMSLGLRDAVRARELARLIRDRRPRAKQLVRLDPSAGGHLFDASGLARQPQGGLDERLLPVAGPPLLLLLAQPKRPPADRGLSARPGGGRWTRSSTAAGREWPGSPAPSRRRRRLVALGGPYLTSWRRLAAAQDR